MPRSFSNYLYADETRCVDALLKSLPWDEGRAGAVNARATDLVKRIRARKAPAGQLETFLQQYSLTTKEGLALMSLAEALLRIPDRKTANAIIRDKMAAADWARNPGVQDWMVKAAGLGLLLTRKTLDSAFSKIGEPFIREAMLKAMRVMGQQFVLGEDIESAVQNAQPLAAKGYRMSYDILGEGARTMLDADRYFESYMNAIRYAGQRGDSNDERRAAMSVKLSALHPRYSYAQRERCVPLMTERLGALAAEAALYNIALTVDAEETDRLELSLEIIETVFRSNSLSGWEGLGLAVQAYQKRAFHVIDHLAELARGSGRRLQVRLVKGAYWDTEVKRAQVHSLPDYPVFTRKNSTDVSYLACAQKMLKAKDAIYPLFGTHNAHTAAAIIEMARDENAMFEFQRLFGMGESLYEILLQEQGVLAGIYAPVGPHEDLLAYLVRRLLENGANTSFVHQLLNPLAPVEEIVRDPVQKIRNTPNKRHSGIVMPSALYEKEAPAGRINSSGVDLSAPQFVEPLLEEIKAFSRPYDAIPLIGGKFYKETVAQAVKNPADYSDNLGRVWPANKGLGDKAFRIAGEAFPAWSKTKAGDRAQCLERYADLLEKNRAEMMALCIREAGRNIPDALAEVREAVDFCRYYANRGRMDFADEGYLMPGATGEDNIFKLHGRGTFVCISPWNFPLAIFTGQIVVALMAGNCAIAKPAEQTPIIALRAVQLMHEAGIPENVLHYLPGDGLVGAALVSNRDIGGVAFTGSTAVAREINMSLSESRGPIVPLIAETGGQNAMIVDSSALPEQVVDDVILSAFGSAGQRCSSLRVLFLQNEIADKVIRLLQGAMAELHVGNPSELSTDIGPVIDDDAYAKLVQHREALKGFGKFIYEAPLEAGLQARGHYFPPSVYELKNLAGLKHEVFGPVLHIIRYARDELDDVIEQINDTGYGLTLGVHTRIDAFHKDIAAKLRAGNVYVNRSMIGAVVGTQPFGGQGLSGTGPKAGGPHYLPRFAQEKVISINTTATGGNTALVSLGE
jgi:RHH-type proline utilization regulon transcriptional repressor/proline dehydrogenase/delta 1-pyrroline-5-carboxylate dehydrogenase